MRLIGDIFQGLGISPIGMCGNFIMGQFQRAIMSIISMGIPEIMISPIWNASGQQLIEANTFRKLSSVESQSVALSILNRSVIRPLNGTEAMREEHGIARMPLQASEELTLQNLTASVLSVMDRVNGVARILRQKVTRRYFAHLHANQPNQTTCEVACVSATNIMRPVYNLTVEGEHCYYAGGVLTHNCDTVVQAIRYLRRIGAMIRGPERTAELAESMVHRSSNEHKPLYPV
jgi:hypothetical protein